MVFQSYTLFPWLTVRENIAFGLRERGVAEAERNKIADAFIRQVGLSGFENHWPKQLSGGMQQRTAIARALANDPRSCCSTSPSARWTTRPAPLMQEMLLGIWERDQKTVLFVTHDIEEAIFLGSRVIVMSARPGRIKAEIDRPAASALLQDQDHARIRPAEGTAGRGDPHRGVEGCRHA